MSATRPSWFRRLLGWSGDRGRSTPSHPLRTRLNLQPLEAREQPAAGTIDPGLLAAVNANNQVALTAAATPGVTRIAPTALDVAFMNQMANRKWQLRTTAVNPFVGGTMFITAEIVFTKTGNFTLNEVGQVQGAFGPVNYYASASGKWWVQGNGKLVLRYINKYPSDYWPDYQFMHIKAANKNRIVSPDGGTWVRIPLNFTSLPN